MSEHAHGYPQLLPPAVLDAPDDSHALGTRMFQGIPSLAVSPGGRLWCTWYAGKTPSEDHNNYVVIATSGDRGVTWTERLLVDPDGEGPVRAFDPELWLDPSGRLWSFWAQSIRHDGTIAGVWAMTTEEPDREDGRWSAPRRLADGVMMCKPIVLSTGEWLMPASTWRDTDDSARVMVSTDGGATWRLRGACHVPKEVRSFDEHMLLERTDGALWMWVRTAYGIGESLSLDRGRTWSELAPSCIQHTSSRFFLRRLPSGNVLLVKHGPIREKTGRSHLTAYLSEDDGGRWSPGLLLDEREGVSYPDGQPARDGTLYVVYDRSRTGDGEILMTAFTEEDIRTADPEACRCARRVVVSRMRG